MNGHYELRRSEKRSLMMRHMNQIDILAPQRQRDRDLVSPEPMTFGLIELLEVCGQRPKLMKIPMRPDQQVLVLAVDPSEIAYQIPDVGPHSELVDFPDVNGDAHGIDSNFSIIAVC